MICRSLGPKKKVVVSPPSQANEKASTRFDPFKRISTVLQRFGNHRTCFPPHLSWSSCTLDGPAQEPRRYQAEGTLMDAHGPVMEATGAACGGDLACARCGPIARGLTLLCAPASLRPRRTGRNNYYPTLSLTLTAHTDGCVCARDACVCARLQVRHHYSPS